MDVRQYAARFMVHKVGSFVVKDRVLCFAAHGFSTFDPETQQLTNTWSYDEVDSASPLEGETDFAIYTPRHRIKKTVYRCHFRMEVLVCLMRLRSLHQAKSPGKPLRAELQAHVFPCFKLHSRGLQSPCVVEIGPDGVYQKDDEGELVSHIPYTSLVSIDLVCDDHNAIVLNHSDNSSLFVVDKRTEMAQAIHRVMRAYGMQINEYRKKTMDAATRPPMHATLDHASFQYSVVKVSSTNKPLAPRLLSVTDQYIAELSETGTAISSRPLARVFALVLYADSTEAFAIVYVDGIRRTFYSPQREKLVAELLASCHALHNTQVEVVGDHLPDALRMVPCKTLQSGKTPVKDAHAFDRELRAVQSSLLQQIASHGSSKTTRMQRQLGIDEGMHQLALELNANTPPSGVIAQPNKPFDKAVFYVAREIRDIVSRHGSRHPFLATYLQTLYRLLPAPPALKEFVGILLERGDGYLATMSELLAGRHSLTAYWTLLVLHRLLETKSYKLQCREILLSNTAFLSSLLSLFDLDPKTQRYLSDLPTMPLCQLTLCLVKTNPERQLALSKTLHDQLARRFRLLHRILFGFPALATVEACVGILARMTNNPSTVYVGRGDATENALAAPVSSSASSSSISTALMAKAVQPPPLSMGFGEHLTYDVSTSTHRAGRRPITASSRGRPPPPPSSSATSDASAGGVVVQNPQVLLRQYRVFLETACGPKQQPLDHYRDATPLRLRYRSRTVFLQELLSHVAGRFDDFQRAFAVECVHFSGFLGKTSGQREKSELFLTPRGLIAVRVVNRSTQEFEYRAIERLALPAAHRDAFAMTTVKQKLLYVYSDSRAQLVEKLRDLAGVLGLRLQVDHVDELPKPRVRTPSTNLPVIDWDASAAENVTKRSGRHGFFRFRRKQIVVRNGLLLEADAAVSTHKSFSLRDLRRVVCTACPPAESPPPHDLPAASATKQQQLLLAMDFADGARRAYLAESRDAMATLLAKVYDGCLFSQNHAVTLAPAFSHVNPRLTTRALLQSEDDRALFQAHDGGLFVAAHRELVKEMDKLADGGPGAVSRVLFTLEVLTLNVEAADFAESRVEKLSFRALFQGFTTLLTQTPLQPPAIAVILAAFCRINHGCYRLASDEAEERMTTFVDSLVLLVDTAGDDPLATLWAVKTLHSLCVDARKSPGHKHAEKAARAVVLGHARVVPSVVALVDRDPLVALAALDLLYDVAVKTRASTDNNQFDALSKALSKASPTLQRLASQRTVVGLAVLATGLLKATLDHTDAATHERMCDAALESGLTLRSVYSALFSPSDAGRAAFQYIAAMWTVHHRPSFALLSRLLPPGLVRMLSSPARKKSLRLEHKPRASRPKKQQQQRRDSDEWFIRRLRQEISAHLPDAARVPKVQDDAARANYPGEAAGDLALLAELLHLDFFLPDLIWNARTREELQHALERAIELIDRNAEVSHDTHGLAAPLVWNHGQFRVAYASLADELVVEGVYLRVLVARLHDGSLALEDVARHVATRAVAVPSTGEAAAVFLAAVEIAKHPAAFYSEVYQRWLELRLSASRSQTAPQQMRMSELVTQAPACDLDLLMKTLIEAARAFPSVRSVPPSRVQFLMELLGKCVESQEATDVLELLARLSEDASTARALATAPHVTTLLFIAVLSHRRVAGHRRIVEDADELPVIGLDAVPELIPDSASSIPVTHFSGAASRLSYRWSVKSPASIEGGPFTVFQLQQLLEPRALASAVVCCCSIHDKHDSSEHEWRPLAQFPELRWLELLAEPLDVAVFGGHALSILRNVVVNEPSYASATGAYLVPMPFGKQLLSARENLAHVVQLLLVDDVGVRELACEILLSLGPASSPKLFEFGLFFFLFAVDVSEHTPFVHETRLLQLFHRVQASHTETRHPGQSYLLEMLPEPLLALLDGDCADDFADAFTGRATDKLVLWTPSMRNHLRAMVREHIDEFEEDLRRDVAATYSYVSLPPVQYSELSRDVYCSGYFLSTIAHGDALSLDAIEEPQVLMASIEDKWRSLQQRHSTALASLHPVEEESASAFKTFGWPVAKAFDATELRVRYRDLCKKGAAVATVRAAYDRLSALLERKREAASGRTSDEVVECILHAQLRLLDAFSFQFFSYEARALPLLLDTIAADDRSDLRDLALRILHKLLAAAPLNIDKTLTIDGVWDTVLDMLDHVAAASDHATKLAGFGVLELLLSSAGGPQSLLRQGGDAPPRSVASSAASHLVASSSDDTEDVALFVGTAFHSQAQQLETDQSRRLCKLLERLLTAVDQRQPWQIQKLLFHVVVLLCHNRHLQEHIVLSTKLFWRALYMLLSTAEDVARGPESTASAEDSNEVMALKERDVVEAAFHALRALSVGSGGGSRSHALDALANLLPMEFLDCLDRPSGHDFWMVLSSEIREPTCIWNDSTRSELMQLIVDHCSDHGDDEDELLFLESSRSYMYDCLKAEPLVGGIYLRVLLAKAEENVDAITAESLFPTTPLLFIEALFVFLNENRDPSLGIYADTLPALECLNVLIDIAVFKEAFVDALEHFADSDDSENESVSVATLGRYLLPFDRNDKGGMSISSRRSLSSYGFLSKNGKAAQAELDGLPVGMEAEFGNVDYLNRQEYALLLLNKICGLEYSLEKLLAPFCRFAWSLQVIADHLDYEQAFYALSCLAELCDTCLVVAKYVETSGLWVEILGIALQSRQHVLHEHFLRAEALREPAFEVLYALLAKDFAIRESMYSGLGRFLPYPIVYQIHLDPGLATKFFDDNHDKSDLVWNSHWRTEVRRVLDDVICRNRIERTKAKRDSVILDEHDYVHMPENFVAGLYLDNFLARPDPENLTNPAYNLELLFQEWTDKLHCLMGFDLENPPQFLKDLAAEVEQLTSAMVHILRAPLNIDESIEAFDMPSDIVRLVRHCNKHVVAGFPYRCALRVARRLAAFSSMQSKDFLELLFCRITIDHPDVPALIKVVRRVLEARSQGGSLEHEADAFALKDLAYFSAMVKYLESIVDAKDAADPKVLSNVNRILRIVKAEQRQETHPISQSFFQRASARWHNFTLNETVSRLGQEGVTPSQVKNADRSFDVDAPSSSDVDAPGSFDVDAHHAARGTFNVDEERASFIAPPPKSLLLFDGETIQELPPAPTSFRYVNGVEDDGDAAQTPVRASTIRATYEPVDSQYHSTKAAEYDRQDEGVQRSRRASLSTMAAVERAGVPPPGESPAPSAAVHDRRGSDASSIMSFGMFSMFGSEMSSSRRYSLLDSWRAPTSNQPNPLLSNMTISRRGRRAAAVYSRRKTHQSNRWFK